MRRHSCPCSGWLEVPSCSTMRGCLKSCSKWVRGCIGCGFNRCVDGWIMRGRCEGSGLLGSVWLRWVWESMNKGAG